MLTRKKIELFFEKTPRSNDLFGLKEGDDYLCDIFSGQFSYLNDFWKQFYLEAMGVAHYSSISKIYMLKAYDFYDPSLLHIIECEIYTMRGFILLDFLDSLEFEGIL